MPLRINSDLPAAPAADVRRRERRFARRSLLVLELPRRGHDFRRPRQCLDASCRPMLGIGLVHRMLPDLDRLCPVIAEDVETPLPWTRLGDPCLEARRRKEPLRRREKRIQLFAPLDRKNCRSVTGAVLLCPEGTDETGFLVVLFSRPLREEEMIARLAWLQMPPAGERRNQTHGGVRPCPPQLVLLRSKAECEPLRETMIEACRFCHDQIGRKGGLVRRLVLSADEMSALSGNGAASAARALPPFADVLRIGCVCGRSSRRDAAAADAAGTGLPASGLPVDLLPCEDLAAVIERPLPLDGEPVPVWQPLLSILSALGRAARHVDAHGGRHPDPKAFSILEMRDPAKGPKLLAECIEKSYLLARALERDPVRDGTAGLAGGGLREGDLTVILLRFQRGILDCLPGAERNDRKRFTTIFALLSRSAVLDRNTDPDDDGPGASAPGAAPAPSAFRGRLRRAGGALAAAAGAVLLSACGTLTGLDAASSFSCPREDGISCASMQETFARADAGLDTLRGPAPVESRNVPSEASAKEDAAAAPSGASAPAPAVAVKSAGRKAPEGLPRRIPERFVTIAFAPWSDADGDLHAAHSVVVRVSEAHWAAAAAPDAGRDPSRPAVVTLPFELRRPRGAAASPTSPAADSSGPLRALRADFRAELRDRAAAEDAQ